MKRTLLAVLVATLALGATGFAQALGTRDNPIIWLFVPSQTPGYLKDIAESIARDISAMTGLFFEVVVSRDYRAFIEDFVAADGNVMGAPTTDQYVQIADRTNFTVTPRLGSVRLGYPYYFAAVYTLREYGFTSTYELSGKSWAYASEGSTSGYLVPKDIFDNRGIAIGSVLPSGSHQRALLNVLDKQAVFATGFWNPPTPPPYIVEAMRTQPSYEQYWLAGWDPELWVWDYFNQDFYPEIIRGYPEDLRTAIGEMPDHIHGGVWDITRKVQVLELFGPIPNDCLAFSAGFPVDLQNRIVAAIQEHIGSTENPGPGRYLWSDRNFYRWTDVMVIDDSIYDTYRRQLGYRVNE